MFDNGYIQLHRKLLDNPIFLNADLLQLFIYCLLKANHKPETFIWNGEEITVNRGQFITGRIIMSKDLKQTESGTYKRLQVLNKLKYISLKSNNKFTLLTVCKYNTYQGTKKQKEQQSNNKVTTKEQQSNTNNNDNNDNNDNKRDLLKKTNNIIEFDNEFLEFWKIYDMDIQQDECYGQWKYIDIMNRALILKRIQNYIDNTDKNFRKEPLKYLRNRMWLDEVVSRKSAKQTTQRNNIQEFKPIRTY